MQIKALSNLKEAVSKTIAIWLMIYIVSGCGQSDRIEWISPYKDIDWDNVIQARAQFHAHTTISDGWLAPQAVVDIYHELGYRILAITDHWRTTYPWTEFTSFEPSERTFRRIESGEMNGISREIILDYQNRDPDALGMVAVRGSEPSHSGPRKHHIVSLFSGVTGHEMSFQETSTDDIHRPHEYHSGFQIQLVENLDQENVYNSLRDGCFFWVAQPYGEQHPVIESIDFGKTSITVRAKGYDQVSWYFNNEVIHTGETFDYYEHGSDDVFYVYFMAHTSDFSVVEGTGTAIGSQPVWVLVDK